VEKPIVFKELIGNKIQRNFVGSKRLKRYLQMKTGRDSMFAALGKIMVQ